MAIPSYMKGRKPIKISLHSVVDVLQHIDEGSSRWFRCRNRLIAPHCRPRRYAYRF